MKTIFGIEVSDEEFDRLYQLQSEGKILKVVNGKIEATDYVKPQEVINQERIIELKEQIAKYKEDVEQVELFGMQRDDYEQKKQMCASIILELRELEKSEV